MTYYKKLSVVLMATVLISAAYGQRPDEVIATSTGMTYKVSSLSPEGQKLYSERRTLIADTRTRLLTAMIAEALLELEIKAQNSTRDKIFALQKANVVDPTPAEIQAVYNANRGALGGRSLEETRTQIVEFIKHEAEDKAVDDYLITLRTKYKVTTGKDVNAVGLGPDEVLATIGTRAITLRDFDREHRVRINDVEMGVFEEIKADLEASIFSAVVIEEAKARNLDTSGFIAAEITDKLRQFTDEERAAVESELMMRLFTKYRVQISLTGPTPIVQNVSVDDDPSIGSAVAPVTIVMFTDFQCPACARAHPLLKQAIASYGDKARLVVRDFPLEGIHPDAFNAALAANAARNQNKFTEYVEVLYRNQAAQDKVSLVKYALQLGLNGKQFELDFSDAKTAAEVRKDQSDGRSYGIAGTPSIFVNGVKVHRLSVTGLRSAIDRALRK